MQNCGEGRKRGLAAEESRGPAAHEVVEQDKILYQLIPFEGCTPGSSEERSADSLFRCGLPHYASRSEEYHWKNIFMAT
jgi:hypothetical protein